MITFDEFKKAEIKIGTILSAEKVPEADKLIKLMINLGPKPVVGAPVAPEAESADSRLGREQEESNELSVSETGVTPQEPVDDIRQILSGIAEYYPDPSVLVGKQVPVLANLPTRTIRGYESQGMVLYAVGEGFLTTVTPDRTVPNGTNIQ